MITVTSTNMSFQKLDFKSSCQDKNIFKIDIFKNQKFHKTIKMISHLIIEYNKFNNKYKLNKKILITKKHSKSIKQNLNKIY